MKLTRRDLYDFLLLFAILATINYLVIRTILLSSAEYTLIERFFSVLLIVSETFIIIHAIGYTSNVFKALQFSSKEKELSTKVVELKEEPAVAILIPARHEPKEILARTFASMNALKYKNKTIYFLDDSSEDSFKKEAEDIAREFNLKLFRREARQGAKAGIINDCLKILTEKYIVIFDADQNPLPEFLTALVPIMEGNERMGFIQTPQFYSNFNASRVARGSSFQQAVFYEYICEGKGTVESMICCGTNVILRREALEDVGGLDPSTVTEDFATSVKLHTKGWKSMYYNHVYVFGIGPETLSAYFKQQFRWATGTLSVFKKIIWQFVKNPFSLTLAQWLEYSISSTYFLIGFIFFCLMLCPVIYLLFNIPSFFAKPQVYFLAFLPYIIFSMSVFYKILKDRNYHVRDLFLGQLLGFVASPVYMRAAFTALLGIKVGFGITQKAKGKALSYIQLWPQISFIFLNFIACVWGMNRFVHERDLAILVNGFWAAFHGAVVSTVFYFNEEDTSRIPCKRFIKRLKFDYKVFGKAIKDDGFFNQGWQSSFTVHLPKRLEKGTQLMCKLKFSNKQTLIFDGEVMWSSAKKGWRGVETDISVITMASQDKEKLNSLLK